MDGQLPAERRDAFVHQDLYPALELISADWERLPVRAPGLDRYRVHIARGRAVYALRLLAELDPDGGISVTSISVDVIGPLTGPTRTATQQLTEAPTGGPVMRLATMRLPGSRRAARQHAEPGHRPEGARLTLTGPGVDLNPGGDICQGLDCAVNVHPWRPGVHCS